MAVPTPRHPTLITWLRRVFDSTWPSPRSLLQRLQLQHLHTHENGQYGLNIFRTHFQTFPQVHPTGIIGKVHIGPDDVYPWAHCVESESRDVAWVVDEVNASFASAQTKGSPFFLTVGFVDTHRDVKTGGGIGNARPFDPRVKDWHVDKKDVCVPDWLPDWAVGGGQLLGRS